MTGVKRNLPTGFRRIKAIASGETISHNDDSGDVDVGRLFEARVLAVVKKPDTNEPLKFKTKNPQELAYVYKIRILEKSDDSTFGNEFLANPNDNEQMVTFMQESDRTFEEARTFLLNLHPEGVFLQEGDATEIPKVNDTVIASTEKIQGRFVLTKKFGTMAKVDGGYDPVLEGTEERILAKFKTNGKPVSESPGVFLANNSVKWDCVDPEVKAAVAQIAEKTGLDITVTSGFRDTKDAAAVGSSNKSQHTYGQAVDIRTRDKTREELSLIKEAALQVGFKSPPPLRHGTAEHFHFELAKNKNKPANSGAACSNKIARATGIPGASDDATGKPLTGQSSVDGTSTQT